MNEDFPVDIVWKLLPNYGLIVNRTWESIYIQHEVYSVQPMHIATHEDEFGIF